MLLIHVCLVNDDRIDFDFTVSMEYCIVQHYKLNFCNTSVDTIYGNMTFFPWNKKNDTSSTAVNKYTISTQRNVIYLFKYLSDYNIFKNKIDAMFNQSSFRVSDAGDPALYSKILFGKISNLTK